MATVEWNYSTWQTPQSWPDDGDGWSVSWGGPRAQWHGCILPRIFPFLGGDTLEIACGRGRWVRYLERDSTSYIGVDLAPLCIDFCRERFPKLRFELTDGRSLPMILSSSMDFVFSFDSLVHANADVVAGYVKELARVLRPGRVAFIHYTQNDNSGEPESIMLPAAMRDIVKGAGMSFLHQETIVWGNESRIDCFITLINKPGIEGRVTDNPRFTEETAITQYITRDYATGQ